MGRLGVAFSAFFRILGDSQVAEQVKGLLAAKSLARDTAAIAGPKVEKGISPPDHRGPELSSAKRGETVRSRSEAVTLLAMLQREARLVDLVLEPLDGYSDAQIGAAARDVLRDCRRVLEQSFAVTAIVNDAEGQSIEVPLGYDPGIFRLIGNVSGAGPFRGTVVHRGWKIVQCQLPAWTGSSEAGKVLTAAEIEVKGT